MAKLMQTPSFPPATSLAKAGALLLLLLMLASLAWKGMSFWDGLRHQESADVTQLPIPTINPDKSTTPSRLPALFGSPDQEIAMKTVERVPESNLNLQVSAIFFGTAPAQSTAVLEDGSQTLILKPGEEVRPGISIAQIESNRVTLKRNGKLEQLSFRGFGEGEATNLENLPIASTEAQPQGQISQPLPVQVTDAAPPPTAYQQFIQRKIAQNQ